MPAWSRFRDWLTPRPGRIDLSALEPVVTRAGRDAERLAGLPDDTLREHLADLPADFVSRQDELARFLAVMREYADRRVGLRPYDVQLQAAAAMLRGTSVELATGEGKTLVGAIVAAGLVRAGRRTQVLSANDYLAERDAGWMGPLIIATGPSVAFVTARSTDDQRRSAYAADVVYVSVTEAGFDILRERLRGDPAERVGIAPDAAILDEADAVLLDEARVPLVLAGASAEPAFRSGAELADVADGLVEGVDYQIDRDRRTLHLTDAGIAGVEAHFPGVDLFGADHEVLSRVNVALHAKALLARDVDYVVEGGRARLVSQSRGRVEVLQRWPDGLQEAVEAKEGLAPSGGVEILDQLLVRDLVGLYTTAIGMSATLVSAADELNELYGLPVAALPPHRLRVREDEPDRLYASVDTRDAAAVALVDELHQTGQPILVATQSVAESERFGTLLRRHGLAAVVLNAKNDAAEAEIIARAGSPDRITVSTQMAGRGTDIRLVDDAVERGGLCIVGLGRFPNRRLDDQLRGRAGRQGDPGRTVFFTSLEDPLVDEFAPEHPAPVEADSDGLVLSRRLRGLTDQAQRASDGQERELRALARRYGKVIALQRDRVLEVRRQYLVDDDLCLTVLRDQTPTRIADLVDQVGELEVGTAARRSLVSALDRLWSAHLAYAAEVREGIHLRALARQEPVVEFNQLIHDAFAGMIDRASGDAAGVLDRAEVVGTRIELDAAGIYQPGATWTYMVTDNHFGSEWERIGSFIRRDVRRR